MFNQVKDSGARQEFETGSVRDTQDGKGDYSLLPFIALSRVTIHFQNGSKKYNPHNWRKGQPLSRYFSSGMRHAVKWFMGMKDEDHLAAAIWNFMCALETEDAIRRGVLPAELDDRLPNQGEI